MTFAGTAMKTARTRMFLVCIVSSVLAVGTRCSASHGVASYGQDDTIRVVIEFVEDTSGNPVEGIRIQLLERFGPRGNRPIAEGHSDKNGIIQVKLPGANSYKIKIVSIDKGKYATEEYQPLELVNGSVVEIRLFPAAAVEGKVTKGPGITRAFVRISQLSEPGFIERVVEVDSDGRYKVENLNASVDAQVAFSSPDSHSRLLADVKLAEGKTRTLPEATLTKVGSHVSISGRVSLDAQGQLNQVVIASSEDLSGSFYIMGTGVTDQDGKYSIRDLPSGKYVLEVQIVVDFEAGQFDRKQVTVQVVDGQTISSDFGFTK